MQTTVELQDMFSYSLAAPGIIGLALLAPVFWLIIRKILQKLKERPQDIQPIEEVQLQQTLSPAERKNKYGKLLTKIEYKYNTGEITAKQGFAELSKTIRLFVYEVTGIKVQNYTLEEIGQADMPKLYELISECYVPEFKEDGSGDILKAVDKARKVIMQWK